MFGELGLDLGASHPGTQLSQELEAGGERVLIQYTDHRNITTLPSALPVEPPTDSSEP